MAKAYSLKTDVITVFSENFALHFLKGAQLHVHRNDIFGLCIIAIYFLGLFPYTQDLPKF